ncbi:VOC family protein [Saccharopolyspora sp. TS4A08]|uniref:VOC family protein n=1 Tax=Saccharopolyspora ipomoeae TaxID=3042027 RepID=A0ABT6PNU5_9PSEU|nr:VOC family protein [Saccharopolyspora sp. TS4A08]MDI2029333.1 VOC family protein [Saccharopolyspora sp. TS4A08]
MTKLDSTQPNGTPAWIDLGIPDLDRAMEFYGAVFGWEFDVGPEEMGRYTMCLVEGREVAAIMPTHDESATEFWWNVYFATDDVATTVSKAEAAGGQVVVPPMDVMDKGRMALVKDPVGAQFGLWHGQNHVGTRLVNEPNALLRNDLVTPDPGAARAFYASVFDFGLDSDGYLGDDDFTFLRRPDGHEIGGIVGDPAATSSAWGTLFMVDDADATAQRASAAGGTAAAPYDMVYGRMAEIRDPFGTPFSVGAPKFGG